MRKKNVQMSLENIYNGVLESIEKKESNMVSLLEEHIDLNEIIPEIRQQYINGHFCYALKAEIVLLFDYGNCCLFQ